MWTRLQGYLMDDSLTRLRDLVAGVGARLRLLVIPLVVLLACQSAHANQTFAPATLRLDPDIHERMNRVLSSLVVFSPQLLPEQQQDLLEYDLRARDRLRFFTGGNNAGSGSLDSVGYGALLAGVTAVLVARAPRPVRQLFVGSNRIGPAVLDAGGLGIGAVLSF